MIVMRGAMRLMHGEMGTELDERGITKEVFLVPATRAKRLHQAPSARRRFPARALHVVDIENLAGTAVPTLSQVAEVQGRYGSRLGFGADDLVVMAASHRGLLNVALGWPHARYRVRSGPDGADLELLDVLMHEDIAARFTHVVIGSGDGAFVQAAGNLAERGVRVTVVSRRDSLALSLARSASDVVYLDAPQAPAA
jgi:NYN domain